MRHKKGILKVGVTGGIGSGKSTVCRMFGRLGVDVLYADDIAREISNANPAVRRSIVKLLGKSAYRAGSLNRGFVASVVFSRKSLQQKLNAIVHPEVEKELGRRMRAFEKMQKKMVIVEAALIYEAKLERKLDLIIVVDAHKTLRLERLRHRGGASASDIRKRMRAQWSPRVKRKKADYLIYNNSTLKSLEQKVKSLYAIFQNL